MGAVITDGTGRILLIKRGRPPGEGLWSVPGGRVEPGETDAEAVAREVREETGLAVTVGALLGSVVRGGPEVTYDIFDYAATPAGGTPHAGDDAADAAWFAVPELDALPMTPGLVEALTEWGALPGARRGHG